MINPNGENEFALKVCSSSTAEKFGKMALNFNQWGYVYAGLYGYKFNEGSRKEHGVGCL